MKNTRLSVNINKFATLRNARGKNNPDVLKVAEDCESFGAEGITVHPRPDERHIRYNDVLALRPVLTTEFNIEGNPIPSFTDLVMKTVPAQVTMVPDSHDAVTSNAGWDLSVPANRTFLREKCRLFHSQGIRCSIFIAPDAEMVKYATDTECDRVELFTEGYAELYGQNRDEAAAPYIAAAEEALRCGIGLNAGHDLNLENLRYFVQTVPAVLEVSIGHALICDALYLGLEKTISRYLDCLK